MTEKELNTLKQFVVSNNSFSNVINNEEIVLDSTIKIELIIYYLTLNKEYLKQLDSPYKELYFSIIEEHNYIIENNYLLIDGIPITLETLIDLVNKIEQNKQDPIGKVIYFTNTNINREPKLIRPQKGQIIHFREAQKNIFYTTLERALIFERTINVNQDTLPYINRTKNDFIALMNDMILRALNSNLNGYNVKYLKVLAAYLNLFPFMVYAKNKKTLPFEGLNLPQSDIGLRKTTINNPLIDEIEKKLEMLMKRENQLLLQRDRFERDLSINTIVLTRIEQELLSIDKEKANYFFGLYVLRHSSAIYNENLLSYLIKSFQSGTVEINRFLANPIIKTFYINDDTTEFHCSMRLDTLLNIINPNELLETLEEQRVLKMEV